MRRAGPSSSPLLLVRTTGVGALLAMLGGCVPAAYLGPNPWTRSENGSLQGPVDAVAVTREADGKPVCLEVDAISRHEFLEPPTEPRRLRLWTSGENTLLQAGASTAGIGTAIFLPAAILEIAKEQTPPTATHDGYAAAATFDIQLPLFLVGGTAVIAGSAVIAHGARYLRGELPLWRCNRSTPDR